MAKLFTITEGLENLGAIRSGGQGSVYKARKNGGIITAIKILPTPISSETADDKNFISFQNEVQKLKKVNEFPCPNVVAITDSGITATGNLPYIEMEYIEGPDLGELLKPPYDPVFTINKIIKITDHLSNALAHCHQANVKHGDIKSNNIKFNKNTGNYILLDFGLSVMSDEQRRTSIRHAGAIEFMAPEQNSGVMLFETDIYSLGIILFELLAGTVPFPLMNNGEMARNAVMISHMESRPPDLLQLRRQAIPLSWTPDKIEKEMQVPEWLNSMINKCLEKDPAKRFSNGMELQDFIYSAIIGEEDKKQTSVTSTEIPRNSSEALQLREQVRQLEQKFAEKNKLIDELQSQLELTKRELYEYRYEEAFNKPKRSGVSKILFFTVLMIAMGFGGYTAYNSFVRPGQSTITDSTMQVDQKPSNITDSTSVPGKKGIKKIGNKLKKNIAIPANNPVPKQTERSSSNATNISDSIAGKRYRIITTAYFHNMPAENSRRSAYVTPADKPVTAVNEQNEFILVSFTNPEGKSTRGWLQKKDLMQVN